MGSYCRVQSNARLWFSGLSMYLIAIPENGTQGSVFQKLHHKIYSHLISSIDPLAFSKYKDCISIGFLPAENRVVF